MSSDDHNDDDQRHGCGDNVKPTRDERGRWLKGHCPNPNGRPRKKPKVYTDQSDIRIFGNTLVEIRANGQTELMDRRSALLNKIFETAMKGGVSTQRFLYQEFEKDSKRMAAIRAHYDRLLIDWIIDNPDHGDPDFEIPFEVEAEMLELRTLLNHYFPANYPRHGMSENDDGYDDDGGGDG